jgi:nucleotide-binding universal stress UspA family protein
MKLLGKPASKSSKRTPAVLNRIVVPTDFSEASLRGLRYAVRLARPFDASIHLVYVLERPTVAVGTQDAPLVLPEAKLARIGRVRLASLGDAEINNTLPLKLHVCFGHPAAKIVTLARQRRAPKVSVTREQVSLCQKGVTRWLLFLVNW